MYTAHHKFSHEFEGAPHPTVSYLVCSVPRSGSSLLCELLASSELAGAPTEFFDRNTQQEFCRLWNVSSLNEYLCLLFAKKTSLNGVFGCKAHHHQLKETFGDDDIGVVFPNLHFVYIRRRDHVRQAVSFARAAQTEEWASDHGSRGASPVFDRRQIRRMLDWIKWEEQCWETFFQDHGAEPMRLVYEDFVQAQIETVLRVLKFLGVEAPPGLQIAEPTLRKQADAISEQWVARFVNPPRRR